MKISIILTSICFATSFQELIGTEHFNYSPNKVTKEIHEAKRFLKFRIFHEIAGMAEKSANSLMHSICSSLLKVGWVKPPITPNADQMSFVFFTTCNTTVIPLHKIQQILKIKQFDKDKPVVLFIPGWLSNFYDHKINPIVKAFNCRRDSNFMVFDTSNSISTLYTWSALNTDAVGSFIANELTKLKNEIPAEKIHIIGFSLGAQIAGSAARYYKQFTGAKIQRITGLDPANPCFGEDALKQVSGHDANFVDIIHTNPGGFGERNPLGDIDFYANGLLTIKENCFNLGCSHMRAIDYYAESIYPGHEFDFTGRRCTDLKFENVSGPQVPMGLKTPFGMRGIYNFAVNAQSPYGKNALSRDLISSECGICAQ